MMERRGGVFLQAPCRSRDDDAESATARIVEADCEGKVMREIKLTIAEPGPRRNTPLKRKFEDDHHLVCEAVVRGCYVDGKIVCKQDAPLLGQMPGTGHGPEARGRDP